MNGTDTQHKTSRTGESHRRNPDRFFHVMTQGWFMFTREGVRGPFVDRNRAHNYLTNHISVIKDEKDPSAGWRL